MVLDFLSELERAEAELICWGFTGGSMDEPELLVLAESFLHERGVGNVQPRQLLAALREKKMLFDLADGTRTRMAETMRLVARLKLLVPRRMEKSQWLASPDLVNDYRLSIVPRSRPLRNIDPNTIINDLPLGENGKRAAKYLTLGFQLAGYQARATQELLEADRAKETRGAIVSAGTGSGKTLAFYLPALSAIADSIDGSYWTKVLAIYPRTELLKDQLTEAVRAARSLCGELTAKRGGRLLRIGTVYGEAPKSIRQLRWRKGKRGSICPYLRCPDCDGELIWTNADIHANREALTCFTCQDTLHGVDLGLTRQDLTRRPPDILFVTSEILNQRLSDSELSPLLGIDRDAKQRPRFVLLDEVHTYMGVGGAHVALLLRRWLQRSGAKPVICGLSATLREPARFFTELSGLPPEHVAEISPHEDELEYEGAEYMLALRGNPISNSSLLTTTIKTAVLMGRMLDKLGNSVSDHAFGSKSFIFTDDLDVTNRLLFDLRDNEGRNPSTGNLIKDRIPLAALRSSDRPNAKLRDEHGQLWTAAEQIGHFIQGAEPDALRIDRVSSQDPGLNANSEVVVATSALEVGYNDLDAGCVIQHKAPNDAATFMQRKGRAGRRSVCRPWTVVVLSDWGKDRQAFQGFDRLFSPQLRPRELPFRNRYVRKMQAAYALIDWLGMRFAKEDGDIPAGSVWLDLSGPGVDESQRRRQQLLAEMLHELLDDETRQHEFADYLSTALVIKSEEVESLLWDPPRAIFNAAIPTAIRRLETQWAFRGEPGKDLQIPNCPLPEFVTATLFAELATPEVAIELPDYLGQRRAQQRMPVLPALREFAPGRVTRRFSIQTGDERHWIPVPHDADPQTDFPINDVVAEEHRDVLGVFELSTGETKFEAECYRPHCYAPALVPKAVSDSCNGALIWASEMVPPKFGKTPIPQLPKSWTGLASEAAFCLHARQAPLEARRFAYGSRISFRDENGFTRQKVLRFVDGSPERAPRAIGVIFDVDALRVKLVVPRLSADTNRFANILPALRAAKFRDGIMNDSQLDGLANYFQRQWIAQAALGAMVLTAQTHDEDLETAAERLISGDVPSALRRVLQIAFQVNERHGDRNNPSVRAVFGVFASPQTIKAIAQQLPALWEEPGLDWDRWMAMRVGSSFGAMMTAAVADLLPQTESNDVVVDLQLGDSDGAPSALELDVWMSERSIGGGGVIEKLAQVCEQDLAPFNEAFEAQLAPSDSERCDEQLRQFLTLACDDATDVHRFIAKFRDGKSHASRVAAFRELREALPSAGVETTHAVISAISHRILRPGSSTRTDAFVDQLHRFWQKCEDRWGLELDSRAAACLAARSPELRKAAAEVFGHEAEAEAEAEADTDATFFNLIYAQFWARGAMAAVAGQGRPNEFQSLPEADPRLLRAVLKICAENPQRIDPRPAAAEVEIEKPDVVEILRRFYGGENEFTYPPAEDAWYADFIQHAETQSGMFVLPRELEGELLWYVGCRGDAQRRNLGEALWCFVGPTDTNFLRRESGPEDGDPSDSAFAELVGERFFKFWVLPQGRERVQAALRKLLTFAKLGH
ncbi:MAG: protein DpdJ [Verrucomicrobiota bacterium]